MLPWVGRRSESKCCRASTTLPRLWVSYKLKKKTISLSLSCTDRISKREEAKLPDLKDVHGAAFGLARLHSLYDIDSKKMVEQGVIKSNFKHGIQAESKPSVKRLSAWDIDLIASEANGNGLYNTMTDLYPLALDRLEEEARIGQAVLELFQHQSPNKTDIEKKLKTGVQMHDQILVSVQTNPYTKQS